MSQKITIHCRYCRSQNVTLDANATWNVEKQVWELNSTYDDDAWCNDCESGTKLVERLVSDGSSASKYDLFIDEKVVEV